MLTNHHLASNEIAALAEIKARVAARFAILEFILFGSKARGDFYPESDIDLLLITQQQLSRDDKHEISHIVTDVNSHHDTLFSFIAIHNDEWNNETYRLFPLYQSVEKEGVFV